MTKKNKAKSADAIPPELASLIEKAAEFHGHLGPFLTIGVRMGLLGLRKLRHQSGDQLAIEAALPLHVPFSCVIDGLQVTTQCTIGNQKLSVKDADSLRARFQRKDEKAEVTVALDESVFQELQAELLAEALPDDEVRRLAWVVAGIPENKLFQIS